MELPSFEIREPVKNETTATGNGRGAQTKEKQGNTGESASRQGVNGVLLVAIPNPGSDPYRRTF